MDKIEQQNKTYIKFSAKVEKSSLSEDGNTLSGTAHTFGTKVMRFGQWETFSPSVFNKVLKDPNTDARAFVNHNPDLLLGRQSAKTLSLETNATGLDYSIKLPNTTYANDLRESVRRGDLDGMSFGFIPGKWTDSSDAQGIVTRLHTEAAQFIDVSPCSLPAFSSTTVELRADELVDLMKAVAASEEVIENSAPIEPVVAVVEPVVSPAVAEIQAYIDAKTQAITIRHIVRTHRRFKKV